MVNEQERLHDKQRQIHEQDQVYFFVYVEDERATIPCIAKDQCGQLFDSRRLCDLTNGGRGTVSGGRSRGAVVGASER